jgi:hypothetical protein
MAARYFLEHRLRFQAHTFFSFVYFPNNTTSNLLFRIVFICVPQLAWDLHAEVDGLPDLVDPVGHVVDQGLRGGPHGLQHLLQSDLLHKILKACNIRSSMECPISSTKAQNDVTLNLPWSV